RSSFAATRCWLAAETEPTQGGGHDGLASETDRYTETLLIRRGSSFGGKRHAPWVTRRARAPTGTLAPVMRRRARPRSRACRPGARRRAGQRSGALRRPRAARVRARARSPRAVPPAAEQAVRADAGAADVPHPGRTGTAARRACAHEGRLARRALRRSAALRRARGAGGGRPVRGADAVAAHDALPNVVLTLRATHAQGVSRVPLVRPFWSQELTCAPRPRHVSGPRQAEPRRRALRLRRRALRRVRRTARRESRGCRHAAPVRGRGHRAGDARALRVPPRQHGLVDRRRAQ